MGVARAPEEQLQFVRIIDIETDSRHFEDDQGLAGILHSLAVRQEAIVAKTQWDDRRGAAKDAVAAAPIVCGHEHGPFSWRGVEHVMEFGACDQWNVARHHDGRVVPLALVCLQ